MRKLFLIALPIINLRLEAVLALLLILITFFAVPLETRAQGVAQGSTPPPGAKAMKCYGRPVPQLQDVTVKAGIHFSHVLAPEAKYIPESMSGGVLLLDYDRDGWLDIYFTNAPTIAMALNGANVRGALYHNNHDGTFTDVTDKAGIATPCFAMGGAVGDYNNDGWPDIYATCLHGNVLYRIRRELHRVRHSSSTSFRQQQELQVHGSGRAVRPARFEGRRGCPVPQQWRRYFHRCFEAVRSG